MSYISAGTKGEAVDREIGSESPCDRRSPGKENGNVTWNLSKRSRGFDPLPVEAQPGRQRPHLLGTHPDLRRVDDPYRRVYRRRSRERWRRV